MKKIDIFNHIWTDNFYRKLQGITGQMTDITRRSEAVPMMTDLDERFRIMDRFEDYSQILSLASPPLEIIAKPDERGASFPDYLTEDRSQYEIWWTFGWPYDTSAAMARLVFSKLFDRHPNIKIITHHGGAMIPFFEGRVGPGWDQLGARTSSVDYSVLLKELKKRPVDYFRMFYADTAVFGSKAATECSLSFFGPDHVVFASDAPFDPEKGPMYIRETIKVIESLDISEEDRAKIFHRNAETLLGLAA